MAHNRKLPGERLRMDTRSRNHWIIKSAQHDLDREVRATARERENMKKKTAKKSTQKRIPTVDDNKVFDWLNKALNGRGIHECLCNGRKIVVRPIPLTDAERMKRYRVTKKKHKIRKAMKTAKKKRPKKAQKKRPKKKR